MGAVTVWIKAEKQNRNPCIVVVPQCPENKQWIMRDNAEVGLKGELSQERMDNFEWTPKFGLVAVNRDTQERMPKPSAKWLGSIAKRNGF